MEISTPIFIWRIKMKLFGMIGQWLGMLAIVIGIIYEIHTGAHFGYILITIGGFIYAVATKIVHRRK